MLIIYLKIKLKFKNTQKSKPMKTKERNKEIVGKDKSKKQEGEMKKTTEK